MKKKLTFVLMVMFLLVNALPVLADGKGNDQLSNYPDVVDYRHHNISKDQGFKRPMAGFSLQIKNGDKLSDEVLSGKHNKTEQISSSQDSPKLTATTGSKVVINDRSTLGSGSKIVQYDIQYRFIPKGEGREHYNIYPKYVSNFNQVKNIIEKLPLDEEGTYEIYLSVADNAKCLPGATNWSVNGNTRVINESNPNFPNGMFWYFTQAVIEVTGSPADFFPTPEGEAEWKEEFITNAKTYKGEVGEMINIPVSLHNQGEEDITNFACTWYGAGWDKPVWIENEIKLAKGESKEFTIPVTVPDFSKENRLVFRANVDGSTPSSELNQDNNIMIITVQPDGVDIAASLPDNYLTYRIKQGESITIPVGLRVSISYFRG